jgi:DNA-binding transcriptional MerR regulator
MKDTITLQNRIYDCAKLVQQRFGLDPQTLRKWAKNNIVPTPVRLGNKCFYDREAIENQILATCCK